MHVCVPPSPTPAPVHTYTGKLEGERTHVMNSHALGQGFHMQDTSYLTQGQQESI